MKTDKERDKTQLQPAYNLQQQLEGKELFPSEEAAERINDLTSGYGAMLYEESERVARRARADHEITVEHVKKALNILKERERRSWKKGLSGIVAGALFGVALSPLMSASSISSIPVYQYCIGLLFIIFGIILAQYSNSD
ncbi:hypothetical protein H206_01450 [Candidatus Electrothrix aarhusensis]|uniref:Uncharacterized protein n=1 Tax=Candidatus Electrothrix aarhusensis TaxID=1859131 RepID=A0A3S3SLX6_9BACT|nr:hypothetical protein H206_01450 [Candidatus Electrothrix aarhusensis]